MQVPRTPWHQIVFFCLTLASHATAADSIPFPQEAKRLFVAGKAYLLEGRNEFALVALNQSIASSPHPSTYVARAMTWQVLKEYDHAIADSNRAIQLNASLAFAYIVRGWCHSGKNNVDEALADFTTAIQISRNRKTTYVALLGRLGIYFDQDKYAKATDDIDRALTLEGNDSFLYYMRSTCWAALNEADKALQDAKKATELDPQNYEMYVLRGRIRDRRQEFSEAEKDLQRAYQLAPKNVEAVEALAEFYGTCSDEKFRDQPQAIELALALCELSEYQNWGHLELLVSMHEKSDNEEKP